MGEVRGGEELEKNRNITLFINRIKRKCLHILKRQKGDNFETECCTICLMAFRAVLDSSVYCCAQRAQQESIDVLLFFISL